MCARVDVYLCVYTYSSVVGERIGDGSVFREIREESCRGRVSIVEGGCLWAREGVCWRGRVSVGEGGCLGQHLHPRVSSSHPASDLSNRGSAQPLPRELNQTSTNCNARSRGKSRDRLADCHQVALGKLATSGEIIRPWSRSRATLVEFEARGPKARQGSH